MRSATMTNRGCMHFFMVALPGTAKHLRASHGVDPTALDDKREIVAQHLDAHGIPRDVDVHPSWRHLFPRRR